MQYLLSSDEYERLTSRSQALDAIETIINEKPEEDDHGNSTPYAYRFDKVISKIMDILDEVKVVEVERTIWKMPWFRSTEQMLKELNAR